MIYLQWILIAVLGYFVYELRKVKPIKGKDGKDGLNGKDGRNGIGFEPYKDGLRARNKKGEIVIEYSKPLKK